MLLGRVSGQSFDALLDHADGPRRRSCVRGPPHPRRRCSDVEPFLVLAEE
jgi:hypothetical protein